MVVTSTPAPCKVIPFLLIVTEAVQVQEPDGTTTVSPVEAEFMDACMSVEEHDFELMIVACPNAARQIDIRKTGSNRFM